MAVPYGLEREYRGCSFKAGLLAGLQLLQMKPG